MNKVKTLLICVLILLVGGAITAVIFSTEPAAERSGATQETAMLVDVVTVQRDHYRPVMRIMGTVQPSQDITLSPRVSGQVLRLSSNFSPGSFVQEGDTLLQIDPADYQNLLQQRQSEEQQAVADLEIEMGRQNIARQDYQLLEDSLSVKNESLVLREPQLNAARSAVQSARAAVEQARLNLARTTVQAPFNAQILSRNVNVGSQVATGDELARLVGVDSYWVEATIPQSQLRWLTFSDKGENKGSQVKIRNRTAWPEGIFRTGFLYRLVGVLEGETRMARLLITVPDPLGRQSDKDLPPLLIGSFVEAQVQGDELPDVIRLNRDFIRQNDVVWVMEDGQLRIRPVDVVLRDARFAYIRSGITEEDSIVTTNLSTVADGAPLRLEPSDSTSQ